MYLKAPLSYFTVSRLPCEPSKTRQYQCACVLGTLTFLMRKTDVFSEAVLSADVTHLVDLGCEISLVGFIHCGLKLAQAASLERTMTDTNNKPFFFISNNMSDLKLTQGGSKLQQNQHLCHGADGQRTDQLFRQSHKWSCATLSQADIRQCLIA